jgi:hypothetical protein
MKAALLHSKKKKIRPELRCCCLPEKRIRFGLHGVLGLQVHR